MDDDFDVDGMADVYGDLNDFEKRLKTNIVKRNTGDSSSGDELE
jgi:hypothetical protein